MYIKKLLIFFSLLYCIISCRTVQPSGTPAAAPEWVIRPPKADSSYEYFTATGTDCDAGDPSRAQRSAMDNVLIQLGRYFGSSITLSTETAGRTSADAVSVAVQTDIRENAAVHIDHCKIIETFIHPRTGGERCISVSILVQYDRAALAAECKRLAALLQEKEDSIRAPEAQGDLLAEAGNPHQALLWYIEAARAAAYSGLDNSDVRYERNMKKARTMVDRIKIAPLDPVPVQTVRTMPFSAPFAVRFYADTVKGQSFLAEIPVLISYTAVQPKTGRKSVPVQKALSGADGTVSFVHPPQSRSYDNGTVVIALDSDTVFRPLLKIPPQYKAALKLLEEQAQRCRVQFYYRIDE